MFRITKNLARIQKIKRGNFEIDSFVIIPGVTFYKNIFSKGNSLYFSNEDHLNSIEIEFQSEGELDRFFTQLMREMKINYITNLQIDSKK